MPATPPPDATPADIPAHSLVELDPTGEVYADKAYGCWMGKNCGGTLGTPLEEAWGRDEPFDVWWYPELAEGGLPNDDLEMQLAWLKAVEEVGPGLTARDLARYWLDHVGYNFDEYGLSKTNLRLGLEPPVSGSFANWFVDCMGCPIRSEIWACLAPAAPRVAVRYAYADAICDHAGGESVYGEAFNAALESAAFVVSDPATLVQIGLSYVPAGSATDRAIRAAVTAHAEGVDWKQARARVLAATPSRIAQYSPINLGFQVIGLLYGRDFGEGICLTVNCGYDTDSSGAAIGSYLGILAGRSGLPSRWTEPLGEGISTNESWGGVRHMSDGPNPIPRTLDDLVVRLRRSAIRVLSAAGALDPDGIVRVGVADLYADDEVHQRYRRSVSVVTTPGPDIDVDIDYGGSPVAAAGVPRRIVSVLTNRRPDDLTATVSLLVPDGWEPLESPSVVVPTGGSVDVAWALVPPGRESLANANRLLLAVDLDGRPSSPAVPVTLVGARALRVSPRVEVAPDDPLGADPLSAAALSPEARSEGWSDLAVGGNAVRLGDVLAEPGRVYLQGFLHSPDEREVGLGADTTCRSLTWVNGAELDRRVDPGPIRPAYGRGRPVRLRAGWNEVLVLLTRLPGEPVPECHLLVYGADRLRDGQPDLLWTRYPWD